MIKWRRKEQKDVEKEGRGQEDDHLHFLYCHYCWKQQHLASHRAFLSLFFTVLEDCFRKMFQIKMSMFVLSWAQVYGFRSIFPWIPDLTFFILHGCKSCLIKVRMWHNCADLKPQLFLVCFSFLCIAKCMAKF